MAEKATCAGCGTEQELPVLPSDSMRVIAEPQGWVVVTLHPTDRPIRSVRLCGYCSMISFAHLDWAKSIVGKTARKLATV